MSCSDVTGSILVYFLIHGNSHNINNPSDLKRDTISRKNCFPFKIIGNTSGTAKIFLLCHLSVTIEANNSIKITKRISTTIKTAISMELIQPYFPVKSRLNPDLRTLILMPTVHIRNNCTLRELFFYGCLYPGIQGTWLQDKLRHVCQHFIYILENSCQIKEDSVGGII